MQSREGVVAGDHSASDLHRGHGSIRWRKVLPPKGVPYPETPTTAGDETPVRATKNNKNYYVMMVAEVVGRV